MQKDKGIKDALESFNLKAVTGSTMLPPVVCVEGKSGGVFCVTFLCLAVFCYCAQPGYTFRIPVIVSFSPTKLSGPIGGNNRGSDCRPACPALIRTLGSLLAASRSKGTRGERE